MSISRETARLLLQEVAALTPQITSLDKGEDDAWLLSFDDKPEILVEWADQPERLVLSACLGRATEPQRLAVYETLLSYNLLWQDTGGVRMALDGPEGEVFLIYDLFDDQVSVVDLQGVLLNLANIAGIWGEYVTRAEDQARDSGGLSSDAVHLRA